MAEQAAMDDQNTVLYDFGDEIFNQISSLLTDIEEILTSLQNKHCKEVEDTLLLKQDNVHQVIYVLQNIANIFEIDSNDSKEIENLLSSLRKIYENINRFYYSCVLLDCTNPTKITVRTFNNLTSGRPKFHIPKETLEELRGIGFTWTQISQMFQVSRWTISRRVQEYNLQNLSNFSEITDTQLDSLINNYISLHGPTTGEPLMSGYLRYKGYRVQRHRVRSSLNRVDPKNTLLRWGALVSRRSYFVPWANSLWHIDGHHSLIRWKFVIHGGIDGKSRKIVFLKCSTNNKAETVLNLFLDVTLNHGYPSRVRGDYGVENALVYTAMTEKRGENRGSFIAGKSTRNQRIERLWRDVFRCVAVFFYYVFYGMEETGLLDIEDALHMFALHHVFHKRINIALKDFQNAYNEHRLSTEKNWTPNQIWFNSMNNISNPISEFTVEEETDHFEGEFYGEDPEAPLPFDEDTNNVTVTPVDIPHGETISESLTNFLANKESVEMGIDVYCQALEYVKERILDFETNDVL